MKTALILLAALAAATNAQAPGQPQLEVHFIDVGQGDAMLIRSPAGKTVLIDAGNIGAGVAVNDYLEALGVKGLDLVIVSHPHLDHMGGMKEVLEKHPPANYLDPGYDHPIENYDELMTWLETNAVPVKVGRAGRVITIEPGITMELYSPEVPLLEGTRSDANSNSIVIKLVHGDTSFLFTGDSEDETEQRVMTRADNLASTVLKVAHHGGKHSTSEGWLAKVQPRYAVISCGSYNRYGHPTKETLGRLAARGTEVFRTDRQGDIIARTDGKTIRWETTGDRSARIDEKGGVRSYSRGQRDEHGHRPKPALVDLNTATEEALAALPEIGAERARAIVEDRARRGPFADLDSLLRIRGVTRDWLSGLETRAYASKVAGTTPAATPELATVTLPTDTARKAPRPQARPGKAYRTRNATTPPTSKAIAPSDRLLSGTTRVNVNLVDATELAIATGLPVEATSKVIDHRDKHGFFLRFADLAEVEGLSTEERSRIDQRIVFRLDLNKATQQDLEAIKLTPVEARGVLEYRQKFERFVGIDELEQVERLSPRARLRVEKLLTAK